MGLYRGSGLFTVNFRPFRAPWRRLQKLAPDCCRAAAMTGLYRGFRLSSISFVPISPLWFNRYLLCHSRAEGMMGLYRGFGLSIITFVPSSALWWGAYGGYQKLMWQQLDGWWGGSNNVMTEFGDSGSSSGGGSGIGGGGSDNSKGSDSNSILQRPTSQVGAARFKACRASRKTLIWQELTCQCSGSSIISRRQQQQQQGPQAKSALQQPAFEDDVFRVSLTLKP